MQISKEAVKKELERRKISKLLDERRLARTHLFYFCEAIEKLNNRKFFTRDKPHVILNTMIFDLVLENIIEKFTISEPPRAGKSYTTTFAMAKAIGDRPDDTHMRNSYSADLAVKFLSHAVREIVKSDAYRSIYPEIMIDRNANSKDRWNLVKKTRPVYCASGVGGSQSGFGCSGLLILDDEYSGMSSALSEAIRKQTNDWIDSVHKARVEKGHKEGYICTRWTEFDRIGQIKKFDKTHDISFQRYYKLLSEKEVDDFRFEEVYQILKEEVMLVENRDDTFFVLDIPALVYNDDGQEVSYCEVLFSTKHYIDLREKYRKRGQEWLWSAVYMQKPEALTNRMIQDLHKFSSEFATYALTNLNCVAYIDPAFGGGDYFCMPVSAPCEGKHYVVDVIYTQEGTDTTIPMVLGMIRKHRIKLIEVEDNHGGAEFIKRLRTAIKNNNLLCRVKGKTTPSGAAKKDRIWLSVGDIHEFIYVYDELSRPKGMYEDWLTDLLSTDVNLSNEHDDAIDATSGLSQMKVRAGGSATVEAW